MAKTTLSKILKKIDINSYAYRDMRYLCFNYAYMFYRLEVCDLHKVARAESFVWDAMINNIRRLDNGGLD